VSTLKLRKTTKDEFLNASNKYPDQKFAKTFISKADMQSQWEHCIGAWEDGHLLGAIITTISVRKPHVANLQLLHSFVKYKGVGRILCEYSLRDVGNRGAEYYRVSSEIASIGVYGCA
jgi:hypothetical protein